VRPFRIKICGLTRHQDISAVSAAGADAIGINLVPTSPRCVSLPVASQLAAAARAEQLTIAVVLMNPSSEVLHQILQSVAFDVLQLHGQESPQLLGPSCTLPILKALSWTGRSAEQELADQWRSSPASYPLSFLVDAYAPGVGGGSGKIARWDLLQPRPPELAGLPLVLAGGLRPDNVAQAIRCTACDAVDTASGVEASPGVKDPVLVKQFVEAANMGFADNSSAMRTQ